MCDLVLPASLCLKDLKATTSVFWAQQHALSMECQMDWKGEVAGNELSMAAYHCCLLVLGFYH